MDIELEKELIIEINKVIDEGTYMEYLSNYEHNFISYLAQFSEESLFKLLNETIMYHNINFMNYDLKCGAYNRNFFISMKLLINLPEYYYKNIEKPGSVTIYDIQKEVIKFIGLLQGLESIYIYYPNIDKSMHSMGEDNRVTAAYFRSYYFDYDFIEMDFYYQFIVDNENFLQNELPQIDSIKLLNNIFDKCYLMQKNNKCSLNVKKFKVKSKINKQFKIVLNDLAIDIHEPRNIKYTPLIEILNKDSIAFCMKGKKQFYIPMNYFWMDKLYKKIIRSSQYTQGNEEGMTFKSRFSEINTERILIKYFGQDNVFSNIYLKKSKGNYTEKDFIIKGDKFILSVEVKSHKNIVPILEDETQEDFLKRCRGTLIKGRKQLLDVEKAIEDNNAKFYDHSKRKNKLVLDLSDAKKEQLIKVIILDEDYKNIVTDQGIIFPEKDGIWIIDLKTMEMILKDTIGNGKMEQFLDYARKRSRGNNGIRSANGEEIRLYNLYKTCPILFERALEDYNISIHI